MPEFDVEVPRARRRRKASGADWLRRLAGLPRVGWVLLAALGLVALVFVVGTPHVWSGTYECRSRSSTGECRIKVYPQCWYIGIQGWRSGYPDVPGESCDLIKFFRPVGSGRSG